MPDLVVVPTALRQARAARRLCDAQGGFLLGARVTTLHGLVPGLLAGAGEARRCLSPLAERLLALEAARGSGLLGDAASAPGTVRAAAALVAELRRGEVSASAAGDAAASLAGRPGERLAAAGRALRAYEARLDSLDALDAAGAMRAAAEAARRGVAADEHGGEGLLVLEGLAPVSPGALDLASALVERARRVLARVPYFPDRPDLAVVVEPWLRRLEALHGPEAHRDVTVVATGAAAREGGERAAARRVLALPAPGEEEQAEAAARLAGRLLDEAFPAEEIAVVAPRRMAGALTRAFAAEGVPFASGTPVALAGLPVVRDLATALAVAEGLERSGAEALLASPYLGFGDGTAGPARLLTASGALDGRGDPEAALRARAGRLVDPRGKVRAERRAALRAAAALRRARQDLAVLGGRATPREWGARLRAFVARAGVRRRAARGDASVARRDLEALRRWEEAVDGLVGALATIGRGADVLGRAEMADLLRQAVEGAVLPPIGEPASGAVELWSPEEAQGLAPRAMLVLGAERGTWPLPPVADPLLGEPARGALNAHLRRRAVSTGAWRLAEAEHAGHAALAAGSEVLAVGWTRGPDGERAAPLAAEALAEGEAGEPGLAFDPPLAEARSAGDALRAAGRLSREGLAGEAVRALAAHGLASRAGSVAARGDMERERRAAWLDGRPAPSAGLVPASLAAAWRARLPGEWSATRLETFARCPYRLFLQLVGVPDAAAGDLDMAPREEGSLLHEVLEAFLRDRVAAGAWPPTGGASDRQAAERVTREAFGAFEAQGRVGDPATWRARRAALQGRVQRWIDAEARRRDGLRPELLEHRFGGESGSPAIVLRDGAEEVRLEGRIDRVDADAERLLVLDYKNARDGSELRGRLTPESLGVTSFQIPLYVIAAARALPGRTELAATYALLRTGDRLEPWRVAGGDPFLATDEQRRAEVRAVGGRTFADAVVEVVGRIRRGELPVASRDCTGCPFGAVCRFPEQGSGA